MNRLVMQCSTHLTFTRSAGQPTMPPTAPEVQGKEHKLSEEWGEGYEFSAVGTTLRVQQVRR